MTTKKHLWELILTRFGLGFVIISLFVYAGCPGPTLNSPQNNATNVDRPVNFNWEYISQAKIYRLQIATSQTGWDSGSGFQSQYLVYNNTTSATSFTWSGAEAGKTYYWSVRGENGADYSDYSTFFSFTTTPPPPTPTANFSSSPTSGVTPLTVQFTDQSTAGSGATLTNWLWNFGDGATSASQNPSHIYTSAGSYTVTLTVTNSFGNQDTETKTSCIIVSLPAPYPTAAFSASPLTGNAPLNVAFTDQSAAGASATLTNWLWEFGDGSTSSSQNPTHTYNSSGIYTVKLTVTNSSGNQDIETKTDYINVTSPTPNPTADFVGLPLVGYAPLNVQFTDRSLAGNEATITNWLWEFGDGAASTIQNPIHLYDTPGIYTVTLTVKNSFSNQNTMTKTQYIHVNSPTPTPTVSFSAIPRSGNPPLLVQFIDSSLAGTGATIKNWKWEFGDGTTSANQNPSHTYNSPGAYTVTLTVTNSNGKKASRTEKDYIYLYTGTPKIGLNRTHFNFGAIISGMKTTDEKLVIRNTGNGILNWSVSSDSTWIKLYPISGRCSGTVTVSIDPMLLAAGTYNGSIIVTDANASNSPQSVSVTLNVYQPGSTGSPFGDFATPTNGSTVSSSVPVTGWALDDIEVTGVKIYNGDAFIGDAVFIEGPRPDVQIAYPTHPLNYKAGWGYMLLTNFLPNGGNGAYTIYAKAIDKEGNMVTLGSKTIYCDNEHAFKPFGNIDTPAQGGAASGKNYVNFGWVLTPLPNYIPVNGSTINIVVDGVIIGNPIYNIFRSDIATLFPGFLNSLGAVGYYYLDTTKYTDGIHTIAWIGADSAGNSDGIGSRYFSISNADGTQQCNDTTSQNNIFIDDPNFNSITKIIESTPNDCQPIGFKQENDFTNEFKKLYPNDNGMINIEIQELGRLEINLSGEEMAQQAIKVDGYLVVGDELRELPIGSTLDSERGVFYWQPGPGFVGEYRLLFLIKDQNGNSIKKEVTITITPKFKK